MPLATGHGTGRLSASRGMDRRAILLSWCRPDRAVRPDLGVSLEVAPGLPVCRRGEVRLVEKGRGHRSGAQRVSTAKKRKQKTSDLALAFPAGHAQAEAVGEALARARGAEAIADLYDGWLRLRVARASAAAEVAREREKLEVKAGLMLKSVQSARGLTPPAGPSAKPKGKSLAKDAADPFGAFLASAERELEGARTALAARAEAEERFFESELEALRARIAARVEAVLEHHRPRVEAMLRPVGRDRALVHLAQPSRDDAVLLCFLLSGKLPTRYEAFFDDTVDDLALSPAPFFGEEGVPARPASLDEEDAICVDPERRFVPLKAMIAFRLPGRDWPRFRLVNRGPLAELEVREEGGSYERLLPLESAELFSGLLIRLEVERRIELAIEID